MLFEGASEHQEERQKELIMETRKSIKLKPKKKKKQKKRTKRKEDNEDEGN